MRERGDKKIEGERGSYREKERERGKRGKWTGEEGV